MKTCEHADRAAHDKSIRCAALREQKAKWDFCIHQYFCRNSGRYEISDDAAKCTLKNKTE